MPSLQTGTAIEGNADAVWATLMDFDAYPEWNPFIREISGRPVEGSQLTVRLQAPGHKPMTLRPTVTTAEPGRSFSWLGRLWTKGLFDGHHHFRIEERADGMVLFTHFEEFSGLLAPILMRIIGDDTRAGFELMNDALKERVERR